MPAAISDKFKKGAAAFSTTLATNKSSGATSCTLSSATGLPTDTAVDLTIGRVDASGTRTPSTKAVYTGTISGTTVSNLTLVEGTDQLHAAGSVVEVTFTANTWNDAVDGILTEHNQDGTHGDVTADSLAVDGTTTLTGNLDVNDSSTAIRDSSDNELVKFSKTASAVNEVTVTNAATGSAPQISATGGDTNIPLKLSGKGTGAVQLYVDGVDQLGAWQSWSPTISNLTLGNGTLTGYYTQIGKTVHAKLTFVLGSTSDITGGPSVTLPVTSTSNGYVANVSVIGQVGVLDSGVAMFPGVVRWASTTAVNLLVIAAGSTYGTGGDINASVPMNFGTNDVLTATFTYEAA